jgi:hypothetical protein
MSNKIPFEPLLEPLAEADQAAAQTLHTALLGLGCVPAISKVGSKPNNWKCEYKLGKPPQALCVLRLDGSRWSLRCKLFHLADHPETALALTEPALHSLLASKQCAMDAGRCQGPVRFTLAGQPHALCRHSMQFAPITPEDTPGILHLLKTEASIRDGQAP